jgi:hypothetical protein
VIAFHFYFFNCFIMATILLLACFIFPRKPPWSCHIFSYGEKTSTVLGKAAGHGCGTRLVMAVVPRLAIIRAWLSLLHLSKLLHIVLRTH